MATVYEMNEQVKTAAPAWWAVEDAERDEREAQTPWPISGDASTVANRQEKNDFDIWSCFSDS